MKFQRALLRDVEGYTPGEQPQVPGIIKLNTNENPYPPSPKVLEALAGLDAESLRKYPDPVSTRFRAACAQRYGYPGPEWIMVGNGMDELLALALRSFVDPGDTVLAAYPTYTLYEVLCKLHGCTLQYVELDQDFQLTPEFFKTPARLCFLTRPNAPTGVSYPKEQVEEFCARFNGIVVIDEAYVDFASDSCIELPKRFDNVLVMRTFSKSYSLAGMRLGTVVAQPALINEFLKTKDSYNLNAVAQAVGTAAIQDYPYMQSSAAGVIATRENLRQQLITLGFNVPPSQTNFLLARWQGTPNAQALFQALKDRHIYVRYFNAPRLNDALRITIGTNQECNALLTALQEILA